MHKRNNVFLQNSTEENTILAIKNLLYLLDINVSHSSLNEVKNHETYPSMDALSNALTSWSITNIPVRIYPQQLHQIPLPAIAHLNVDGGHFVVICKVDQNEIHYIDPRIGLVIEVLSDFERKWLGVTLLVEANPKSGEQGYKQKRRQEIFENVSWFLSLALLSLLWTLPIPGKVLGVMGIYLLSSSGTVVSFFLLQKQFGVGGGVVNSFCKLGTKSDCDSVINSPASKLFGIIHLSEVGLWYFAGSVLSIALAGLAAVSVEPFLFVSTLVGVALSFLGIYYQGVVLKKWCPLCLVVVAVLWLQAGLFIIYPPLMTVSLKSFSVLFIGFSLPFIFWLSVRKRVLDSFKVPNLERSLNRFLKSDRIFQKLWEEQPLIVNGKFSHELQSGSPNAPIQLIVVSNPQCGPCAYTHAVLDNLKDFLDEKVNIVYRFTVNTSNPGTVPYQMPEALFRIQQTESNKKALEALSGWYQSSNLEKWKKLYSPTNQLDLDVTHILKEHELWCAKVAIQKTPTIIINGKLLPEEYSVTDLKFQLRKLAEKITESESVS